jgi:hypothetical protein
MVGPLVDRSDRADNFAGSGGLELEQLTDRLGIESELQLTLVAEAKQYRISEARRQQLEGGSI